MAFTSKKHAGVWVGLAVASLAVGVVHLNQAIDDDAECMLSELTATSTIQSLESLENRCTTLNKDFFTLHKDVSESGLKALPNAARLLQDLRIFDMQYATTSDQNKTKPTALRVCFLQLVTAARRITVSLPREGGNANGALGCPRGMLQGIEEKAVKDLEWEEIPSALSALGVHWSMLSVNERSAAPLFGNGPMPDAKGSISWVQDEWGTQAPADMVLAEDLLSQSVQVAPIRKRENLILIHAHRLKEHANALEVQHEQHSASARRYQAMAKLAEDSGNAPLSAYALSRLSHSLSMHGSQTEAITAAQGAVNLTMDPLAQYVLATLRLSSGLLNTDASMIAAEGQLRAARGQLPSDDMEMHRAKMHNEMRMWHWIAKGHTDRCLWTGDAAKFLICSICKLLY